MTGKSPPGPVQGRRACRTEHALYETIFPAREGAYIQAMRINYLLLGLITVTMVIGLYMSGDPEQAENLAGMREQAALSGDLRETAMTILALGLAVFIGYLAITRRG
jgi:hypothetical protein